MGKGTRVRARRSDGSVAEMYRRSGDVLFGAYYEIQAASGLVAMRFGTAGRSRVVCLPPDDARGYADAFEQGATYARLDRAEVLLAAGYPRPDGDEDAWFETVDAWGQQQASWHEATAGTSDPSALFGLPLLGQLRDHRRRQALGRAEETGPARARRLRWRGRAGRAGAAPR